MKNLFILVCIMFGGYSILTIDDNIDFKDENLKNVLLEHTPKIDLNNDGEIQFDEAKQVKFLNIYHENISNFSGLGNFINLESLNVHPKASDQLADIENLMHLKEILTQEKVKAEDLKLYTEN